MANFYMLRLVAVNNAPVEEETYYTRYAFWTEDDIEHWSNDPENDLMENGEYIVMCFENDEMSREDCIKHNAQFGIEMYSSFTLRSVH